MPSIRIIQENNIVMVHSAIYKEQIAMKLTKRF